MRILGLDFGTQTGVALGSAGTRPMLETWSMPAGGGEDVGAFMSAFRARLEGAVAGVDVIIFEEPFVAIRLDHQGKPFVQIPQVRRAYGMAALVEEIAHTRGIECFGVVTVSLKKDFTGNGHADKAAMMRMARVLGFEPKTDHEADALAAWVYALRRKKPAAAHEYDALFARARHA